jgi:hypothetical protein
MYQITILLFALASFVIGYVTSSFRTMMVGLYKLTHSLKAPGFNP